MRCIRLRTTGETFSKGITEPMHRMLVHSQSSLAPNVNHEMPLRESTSPLRRGAIFDRHGGSTQHHAAVRFSRRSPLRYSCAARLAARYVVMGRDQYSSASMIVSTRVVFSESLGSSDPYCSS